VSELGIGEVEGNADDRHAVGAPPSVGEVELGFEGDALGRKLAIEAMGERFQGGALDAQRKVADACVEQLEADRFPALHYGNDVFVSHLRIGRSPTPAYPIAIPRLG
jgi:hypothetical protein